MRIVVALSGGVDSAVAAARLRRDGANVVAVHYRTGSVADDPAAPATGRACCGIDDARDARAVAARLGLPFYVVDASDAFRREVVDDFVAAYAAGRTPNPCIRCNQHVKFGRLDAFARAVGASAVATGHYARTAPGPGGRVRLLRGVDPAKDQSYVLYGLDAAQRAAARFPLGASTKAEVRAEARALGLPVAEKPDSQELCFVPGGDPRAVLHALAPDLRRPGPVVDGHGVERGRHDGAAGFTVGQRRGLGIASAAPLYVTEVAPAEARVTVGPRAALLRRHVRTEPLHWVDVDPEAGRATAPHRVVARVRHAGAPVGARLDVDAEGRGVLTFDEPVFAPAPGQACVAYVGDAVLCGAPILDAPAPPAGDPPR